MINSVDIRTNKDSKYYMLSMRSRGCGGWKGLRRLATKTAGGHIRAVSGMEAMQLLDSDGQDEFG